VSLVETLVSMALTLTLGGAIMSLVAAGQTIARTQPEASDLHQRARIAAQAIGRELRDAGAGIERDALAGPLIQRFPPLAPSADGGITIWSVTSRDAQGAPAFAVAPGATLVTLRPSSACAAGAAACAFSAGTSAIAFTPSGCRTTIRIAAAVGDVLQLAAPLAGCALDTTSAIAEGDVHTYRVDTAARQLIRRDEATGSSNPMLDGVASMTLTCFADASGSEAITGATDADFVRTRRVRVTLQFAAANPLLRIPDFTIAIDVTPVNFAAGG
jgi:Tfp pilus assembly protein PilW